MNKKFLSAILFGALMVTSTGTFVSCKDYDDDIDEINGKIDKIETTLADLQSKISNKGVSSVTFDEKTGVLTVVDGDGSHTYTIKSSASEVTELEITIDGKDLKVDGKVVGQVGDTVAVKDGELTINGEATGIKVGQNAILTDNSNGVVTITLPDADGKMQTIKLPTTTATITSISVLTATPKFDYKYGVAAGAVTWDGPKGNIAQGLIKGTSGQDIKLQVFPSTADLSTATIKLVDSEGNEAPVKVTATPYEGKETVTRAASANGMWTLAIEATDDVTADNIAAKLPAYPGSPAPRTAYALQVGGNTLTGYTLAAGSTVASTAITTVTYKGAAISASNKIPVGQNVTLEFDKTTLYDAYLTANNTAQAAGVTVSGKTMTISSTTAAAGKTISLTLNYVGLAAGAKNTANVNVIFEGTSVDPETPVAEVTYKATETKGDIIMDLGTTLSSMSAADAAKYSAVAWSVADPNEEGLADNFIYSVSTCTYYATEADAKANTNPITIGANTLQNIKFAKLAAGTYQPNAKAGSYTLNMTLADANGNEIKKVAVPVKVTLPTFDELFTKSAAFSDNVLTAIVYGTTKEYSLSDAFARVDNVSWMNLALEAEAKDASDKWVDYTAGTALAAAGKFDITNLIDANGKIAKESVAITGSYKIDGKEGLKIDVPAFSIKFKSPFAGAKLVYYVQDAKKEGAVPVALDASGDSEIKGYYANTSKHDGLRLEAAVDNSKVEFMTTKTIFGVTLTQDTNVTATVENKADATTVKLITTGLELKAMPAGSYNTTITVTITDGNGIKTDIELPIAVNK